jgi:RNA polymerase sigma-70 factor (ECF subfamily)
MSAARRAYLTVVPPVDGTAWTDRELVTALAARDPRASVHAWRKYAPRIFGIVERTLGLASDAEDITQDIFLRVFARVHTLRDPAAFGSFVLSVALRVIKWHLRSRRVRKILHLVEHIPDLPIPGVDLEARRTLRKFYEVLDALPADERMVFALRHIEGMTLSEVAAANNISLSTATRRLQRASRRVAKKSQADPALAGYSSRTNSDVE